MHKSVCYSERQYIRDRAPGWKPDYADMVDQCVKDWIDLDFIGPSGVFDICSAKSKAERNEWIDRLPTEAFKAPSEATITNDMEIVADGLAAGADGLITNNCNTMFHDILNKWVVGKGVRNAPFMLNPQQGVSRLLSEHGSDSLDWQLLHQCAINMVMPNTRMAPEKERELLMMFAHRLNSTLPGIGNGIIVEEKGSQREARWERAAQMIRTEEWKFVRDVEDRRLERMRRGRDAVSLNF